MRGSVHHDYVVESLRSVLEETARSAMDARSHRLPRRSSQRVFAACLLAFALIWVLTGRSVRAIGEATQIDVRMLEYNGGNSAPRPNAMKRLAWEVRQRTAVETRLETTRVRFSDAELYNSPLLYFSGDRAFPPFSDAEVQGFRRFVDFGGFVIIDDASPDQTGFDTSVRREISRAFGIRALTRVDGKHVVFRSFYLVSQPAGRVEGPDYLEGVEHAGRLAVVYSRHDLGGAYERDNLGNYAYSVSPGAERQREIAFRLGVNMFLYALCLDYKDDQVHAPFIMRRWAGRP